MKFDNDLLKQKIKSLVEKRDEINTDSRMRAFPNSSVKTYDPMHTLKHECGGHNLVCNHLTDVNLRYSTVMFPYYNGLRRFGAADKNYLHSLYGKVSVNHKIKENLLARIFDGISV